MASLLFKVLPQLLYLFCLRVQTCAYRYNNIQDPCCSSPFQAEASLQPLQYLIA